MDRTQSGGDDTEAVEIELGRRLREGYRGLHDNSQSEEKR